jgi:hypothetical protein
MNADPDELVPLDRNRLIADLDLNPPAPDNRPPNIQRIYGRLIDLREYLDEISHHVFLAPDQQPQKLANRAQRRLRPSVVYITA